MKKKDSTIYKKGCLLQQKGEGTKKLIIHVSYQKKTLFFFEQFSGSENSFQYSFQKLLRLTWSVNMTVVHKC